MAHVLKTIIQLSAVDKASAGIRKMFGNANKNAETFRAKQFQRSERWAARAAGATALAGAGVAALYQPINEALEFEQAIANVGSVSNATASQLKQMGTAARKQGRETMFTANQSAGAMQYLAMAGLSAGESISALPTVLNLAAAGNLDLGQTADIATNIMSGMGMEVKQLSYIGDVLTRTFTSSNATLESVAATMKYAAPIADDTGVSLAQLAAMTGSLASAGIKGQMAGTALRGIMLRLAGPTNAASKALRSIGVNTVDAAGNLRDLPTVLAEINNQMERLPSGRRMGLMKAIFETEGTSAASKLMSFAGSGELQKKTVAMGGGKTTSASVAAARMDTATGALLLFKSAISDLMISIGTTVLPTLAELAKSAALVALSISDAAAANPKMTKSLVTTVAAGTAALAVFGGLAATISAVTATYGVLWPLITLIGTGIAWVFTGLVALVGGVPLAIGAAVVGAGILIYTFWDEIKAWFSSAYTWMFNSGDNLIKTLARGMLAGLSGPLAPLVVLFTHMKKIRRLLPSSPAKDGPLRDLDKLKFSETIGASIKAKPMMDAMGAALDATVAVKPGIPSNSAGSAGQGAGFTYAPTINVQGGSVQDGNTVNDLMKKQYDELTGLFDRMMRDRQRLSFS